MNRKRHLNNQNTESCYSSISLLFKVYLYHVRNKSDLCTFLEHNTPCFFQRYVHGEPIYVHITMGNQSTRAVKKLRLSVKQIANICLFSNAIYKCTVATVEHEWVNAILSNNEYNGFMLNLRKRVSIPSTWWTCVLFCWIYSLILF